MTPKLLCFGLTLSVITACGGTSETHDNAPRGGSAGARASGGVGGQGIATGGSGDSSAGGGSATGGVAATGGRGGTASGGKGGSTGGGATAGEGGTSGATSGRSGGGNAGSAGSSTGGSAGTGAGASAGGAAGNAGGGGEAGANAGASGDSGGGNETCGGLSAKMCTGVSEVCHWENGSCGTGDQPGVCLQYGGGLCAPGAACGCDHKAYTTVCRAYSSGVDTTGDKSCVPGNGAQGDNCFVDADCTSSFLCCSSPIGLMTCTSPTASACPLTP